MNVFSDLIQLETLAFGRVRMENVAIEHRHITWIASLQSRIVSPFLKTITFKLREAYRPAFLNHFPPLDVIYDSEEIRMTPTRLRVEILDQDTYQNYLDGLRLKCPRLSAYNRIDCVLIS